MKLPRLWRTSLTLDFWWGEANLNVASWHIAAFAALQKFGRYWTNNGQRQFFGLIGSAANDPTATLRSRITARKFSQCCR
jgi:hypothetical protein